MGLEVCHLVATLPQPRRFFKRQGGIWNVLASTGTSTIGRRKGKERSTLEGTQRRSQAQAGQRPTNTKTKRQADQKQKSDQTEESQPSQGLTNNQSKKHNQAENRKATNGKNTSKPKTHEQPSEESLLHWLTFFPSRRRNPHVMRRGSRRGSQVAGFCRHSKIFRPRPCCSTARDFRLSGVFRARHPVVPRSQDFVGSPGFFVPACAARQPETIAFRRLFQVVIPWSTEQW